MESKVLESLQVVLKRLKSSHFVRDVAMVGGGIAAAQAISLAFMPFLTRLYGPEAFGIAAAYAAVVSIILPISTMGYASAIVMPESDEDASAVARLSILCALILAPISLTLVHIGKPWLASWTGMEQTPYLLYLIPVTLLVVAFLSVANQSAIRANLFKAKARAYVESTLVTNISKLIGGILAPSGLLLIILTLIGQVTNFVMQMLRVPRSGVLKPSNWFGFKGVRAAAVSQRDFAMYRMPQNVINSAAVGLPVILLSTFSGSSAAGQYSVAVLVLGAPVMLLGQAVGEVFYPKITAAITRRSHEALKLTIKATLVLGCLAIITFGIVALFGPEIFALVLGEEWRIAGQYSQWLAPWLACVLATRAILAAFPALRLQSYMLIQELMSIILRSAALVIGLKYWSSDLIAIALFSLVGVFLMVALAVVGFLKLRKESKIWSEPNLS